MCKAVLNMSWNCTNVSETLRKMARNLLKLHNSFWNYMKHVLKPSETIWTNVLTHYETAWNCLKLYGNCSETFCNCIKLSEICENCSEILWNALKPRNNNWNHPQSTLNIQSRACFKERSWASICSRMSLSHASAYRIGQTPKAPETSFLKV